MFDKINIRILKQVWILCILLLIVTTVVFWQVHRHEFVYFDDGVYVTQNPHIQSGISLKGILWAFSTTYAEFWHPLTWLSLMLDYQIYGLNAGGYHVTNLILHALSVLLLFLLFHRMTGAVWKSAFVAAVFAIHPLRVESVAWVAERKDVLSAFFWMMTLRVYVYYCEKPVFKRYLLVMACFACGLMSKSIVVTLPVVMMLMDYWPLNRMQSHDRKNSGAQKKNKLPLWSLKEKIPFFILSVVFSVLTIYAQHGKSDIHPLVSRLANAPVSFVRYLGRILWPHDMALIYTFPEHLSLWQVGGATLLIVLMSAAVIYRVKRLPFLFVGWFWYAVSILPVIGIITIGDPMADRYIYLPSIGISIMAAWGIPFLYDHLSLRKIILFPAAVIFLLVLSVLAWKQCGYWKNNTALSHHAFEVTGNNAMLIMMHNNLATSLVQEGRIPEAIEHYDEAIRLQPDYAYAYNKRGNLYGKIGEYQQAINDYTEAIRLQPDYALAYNNRGNTYVGLEQYQLAIEDYNAAIRLKPDYAYAFNNRGFVYFKIGKNELGCRDVQRACELGECKRLILAQNEGLCH